MTLELFVAACRDQLDQNHRAREQALSASRALIRQCANTIRAAHRGDATLAADLLAQARAMVGDLRRSVADQASLQAAGYTQDAYKEYVEACFVYAFLCDPTTLPTLASLPVDPAAALNGLAEAASELRRAALDQLRRGNAEAAEQLLNTMDEVYSLLVSVDYPEAVTGGLRRTTDALRAVLERTRGDVTAALRQEQLLAALHAFEARIATEPPPDHV